MSIVKKYQKKIENQKKYGDYTRKQAVREYMKIALKLHDLQVGACRHINRADNLDMFETSFRIEKIAERIEKEYED